MPAGQANPSPPIGPALGQRGINIMEFCKKFNAATKEMEPGSPVPTVITVLPDNSFTFEMKTPPASYLLKKAAKSARAPRSPAAPAPARSRRRSSARSPKIKLKDLNANDVEQAMKIIAGSARSMGLTVEG